MLHVRSPVLVIDGFLMIWGPYPHQINVPFPQFHVKIWPTSSSFIMTLCGCHSLPNLPSTPTPTARWLRTTGKAGPVCRALHTRSLLGLTPTLGSGYHTYPSCSQTDTVTQRGEVLVQESREDRGRNGKSLDWGIS